MCDYLYKLPALGVWSTLELYINLSKFAANKNYHNSVIESPIDFQIKNHVVTFSKIGILASCLAS